VRGTSTGVGILGRSAARRASPLLQGRGRVVQEKEEGPGLRPCEDHGEPGFGCPHVVSAVAEVSRRRQASNKLGKRAPKRAAGSSERGPSSERASAGETVGGRVGRKASPRIDLTAKRRTRIGTRPRVTRDRCSAVATSPKAVLWSWNRGCNGHRILGRVLADGRHPGSSRGVGFHEKAPTVVSAASASSDPSNKTKSRVRRRSGSIREGG